MNDVISNLINSKKYLFVGAGFLGGIISGLVCSLFGWASGGAFTSWVITGAVDAALIGSFIVSAQHYYQTKQKISSDIWKKSLKAGLPLGAAGGLASLLVMIVLGFGDFARIIGWAISGAVAGYVVSRQVPNLAKKPAIIAGAVGAATGCIIMYLDLGYTTGVAIAGASIGFVVYSTETLLRKSWVEVIEYSDIISDNDINLHKVNNRYTLTLGEDLVHIGYSADMHIVLKHHGIPLEKEVSALVVESGKIFMIDSKSGSREELFDGNKIKIKNCELVIGSK